MKPEQLAEVSVTHTTMLASEYIQALQKIVELEEVIAGYLKPVPFPPVAEVPVRVLSLNIDEERE